MAGKVTQEIFIERARKRHGDKYDYSRVVYKRWDIKVEIGCPMPGHSWFWQRPHDHERNGGCPICGKEKLVKQLHHTTQCFIEKANQIHNGAYDYSKVNYIDRFKPIQITCKKHNFSYFCSSLEHYKRGGGCPECKKELRKAKLEANKSKPKRKYYKLTLQQFLDKATSIHGEQYDYSEVIYKNTTTKVRIKCKKHNKIFLQTPNSHIHRKAGCPICCNEKIRNSKLLTKEEFIAKARLMHKGKYDYSLMDYKGLEEKILLICPCGHKFWQLAGSHLEGRGCWECSYELRAKNQTNDLNHFLEKAKETHGDKYDYSESVYKGSGDFITIRCKKHNRTFDQIAINHMRGAECPYCNQEQNIERLSLTNEEFIQQAKEVHGNKYDYSHVSYAGLKEEVSILCFSHGLFSQLGSVHIRGSGCPKCGEETLRKKLTYTTEEFIEKAKNKHGNLFDYSKTQYTGIQENVLIKCNFHNFEFWQTPLSHLNSIYACPKCAASSSSLETFIENFLKHNNISYRERDRKLIKPYELDFVIPSHNLAIECNGIFWHSEKHGKDCKYHVNKLKKCEKQGVRLIQILENEIKESPKLVLGYLRSILGLKKYKIDSEKCEIKLIGADIASKFIQKYSFNDSKIGINLGLCYKGRLVSLMCFSHPSNQKKCKLLGYYTLNNFAIKNGATKLLKYFEDTYKPNKILVSIDRRWFDGSFFNSLGFSLQRKSKPLGWYFLNNASKFNLISESEITKTLSKNRLTLEDAQSEGYNRIWDCGHLIFKKEYNYAN